MTMRKKRMSLPHFGGREIASLATLIYLKMLAAIMIQPEEIKISLPYLGGKASTSQDTFI